MEKITAARKAGGHTASAMKKSDLKVKSPTAAETLSWLEELGGTSDLFQEGLVQKKILS